MSTFRKQNKNDLLKILTDNNTVLKGNYSDYYIYRKDWLLKHLEQEFCLLEKYRESKKIEKEEIEYSLKEVTKIINKTPYSTKINEDLGILGE